MSLLVTARPHDLVGVNTPHIFDLTQEGNSMSNRIVINVAPDMNMVVAQVSPEEVRVSLLCESRTNWVAHNWMDEEMGLDAMIACLTPSIHPTLMSLWHRPKTTSGD